MEALLATQTRRGAPLLLVLALLAACGGETTREAAAAKCLVRVYFCAPVACGRPATQAEIRSIEAKLRDRDDVYSVRFVSKQEAFQLMRRTHPVEVDKLMGNPFPDALNVRPVRGKSPADIAAAVPEKAAGVDEVKLPSPAECSG